MKLYFDSLTTLNVIHAESPVVIFFGTYGIIRCLVAVDDHFQRRELYYLLFPNSDINES